MSNKEQEQSQDAYLVDRHQAPGGAWIARIVLTPKGQLLAQQLGLWGQIGTMPEDRANRLCKRINDEARKT